MVAILCILELLLTFNYFAPRVLRSIEVHPEPWRSPFSGSTGIAKQSLDPLYAQQCENRELRRASDFVTTLAYCLWWRLADRCRRFDSASTFEEQISA
jgi:hypothetical protein